MPKTKINVRSFDFDDCLFNSEYKVNYTADAENNSLIEANKAFIARNAEEINEGNISKVILMVGSLRQSFEVDTLNSSYGVYVTESCFSALLKLSSELQKYIHVRCEIDKYLLTDSFGFTPAGENFDKIIQYHEAKKKGETPEESNFSECFADKSKLNLVYTQMHRAASQNPDAEITYDFYDDDLNRILNPLKVFFIANPDLIPANLSLQLHSYAGRTIEAITTIKGTGKIDYNYEYNLKKMLVDADLCSQTILTTPFEYQPGSYLAKQLTGNKLIHFKTTRDTGTPALATSVAASVASTATGSVTSFFANKETTAQLTTPVASTPLLTK